jgi:hypothetical protein
MPNNYLARTLSASLEKAEEELRLLCYLFRLFFLKTVMQHAGEKAEYFSGEFI